MPFANLPKQSLIWTPGSEEINLNRYSLPSETQGENLSEFVSWIDTELRKVFHIGR